MKINPDITMKISCGYYRPKTLYDKKLFTCINFKFTCVKNFYVLQTTFHSIAEVLTHNLLLSYRLNDSMAASSESYISKKDVNFVSSNTFRTEAKTLMIFNPP